MLLKTLTGPRLITVHPDDTIDTAIALMEEHNIRHLPVVRPDGVPVGMVSDRDILEAVGWLSQPDRRAAHTGRALVGPRRVVEIMSVPSMGLGPDEHAERAARLMLEKHFNAVPVVTSNRIVGIITETDVLRCYVADRNEPAGRWRFLRVADRMHARVFTLRPEDQLGQAQRLMQEKRIRHVPIVSGEKLVGIVSDRDVRRAIGCQRVERASEPTRTQALEPALSEIMTRTVETIESTATLADAADQMLAHKLGALPVTKGGEFVGIITETDLLHVFVAACEA